MDKNHQDKTRSKSETTENELWLPPLSPQVQQRLDRLRSKGKKSTPDWTGFAGRTLWDWIQFIAVLAIPILVAAGTLYFTQQITLQQAQLGITASEKQHQTDIQLANDQEQEATLKSYLDNTSDLLLNHNLRNSKQTDEVRQVARERTLTALRRLDADRNRIVLQFLQDAQLIGIPNAVISLRHADLSNDHLSGANLRKADLSGAELYQVQLDGADLNGADLSGGADLISAELGYANLNGADLSHAKLYMADLSGADLSGADLSGADLSYANLTNTELSQANLNGADLYDANLFIAILDQADLSGAQLSGAQLSGAQLSGADLSGADLSRADVSMKQLAQAGSLQGTTMPDGSRHP